MEPVKAALDLQAMKAASVDGECKYYKLLNAYDTMCDDMTRFDGRNRLDDHPPDAEGAQYILAMKYILTKAEEDCVA